MKKPGAMAGLQNGIELACASLSDGEGGFVDGIDGAAGLNGATQNLRCYGRPVAIDHRGDVALGPLAGRAEIKFTYCPCTGLQIGIHSAQ